ncbi:hypothetical protein Sjap_026016 [Stephania japonica]|uniref:Uncharacterized protein n=1 Tax=Stephania japonica TaxID=461633 RepID=A0AAP0HK26_9MAGN
MGNCTYGIKSMGFLTDFVKLGLEVGRFESARDGAVPGGRRLCIFVCVVRLSATLAFRTFLTRLEDSLCASRGKDGVTLLWNLEEGKKLHSLDTGAIINTEGGIGCAQRRRRVSRFET